MNTHIQAFQKRAPIDSADFRETLAQDFMAPLWEVLRGLTPREPKQVIDPVVWRAETIRQHMRRACAEISTEDAERRVLVLENPKLQGRSLATNSLYAGIQMILPGEIAPCHRHTASALRLILDGGQGFTTVQGEKVEMRRGDFIITPTNIFHEHGALGDEPVMWLDGLDVPIVQMLNAGFSADYPEQHQPEGRPMGDAQARYASGLIPVGRQPTGAASPLFHYPYATTRPALQALARTQEWNPEHGLKMAFSDPTTGRSPIRTMGAYLQLLPAGFRGVTHRETDAAVMCVVEGSARIRLGEQTLTVHENDVFVAPGWLWRHFEADQESVLFSFSDRPLQEYLGFWRGERAAA
jgi:gentisate 1,2-dioxygenase